VLLRVADGVGAGADVVQDGRAIGNVVAAAGTAPRLALAMLPLELAESPLAAGDEPALPEPLQETTPP
jgi:hypothetical protein